MEFEPLADRHAIRILSTVKTFGKTGVEMEALTAASIAALTVYDMVKAVDKGAVIESVRQLAKSGGKSGDYKSSGYKAKAPARPALGGHDGGAGRQATRQAACAPCRGC